LVIYNSRDIPEKNNEKMRKKMADNDACTQQAKRVATEKWMDSAITTIFDVEEMDLYQHYFTTNGHEYRHSHPHYLSYVSVEHRIKPYAPDNLKSIIGQLIRLIEGIDNQSA
jgi:ferredoxin-fold anticodon binding domain-containing protein